MIIFFDATVVCQASDNILARTGVWHIVCRLWESINYLRLCNNSTITEIIPFSLHDKYDILEVEDINSGLAEIFASYYELHKDSRASRIANIADLICRSPRGSLLFAPYGPIKDVLGLTSACHVTTIHYIHDLIPIFRPELCSSYSIKTAHNKMLEVSAGDVVLCNSRYTKDAFTVWWGSCANQLILPRVEVLEPGNQLPQSRVSAKYELCHDIRSIIAEKPYFLSLSTIEPRKNIVRMLHAFNLFRQRHKEANRVSLLLAGAEGWISDEERTAIGFLCANSNGGIIRLGYVDDVAAEILIENTMSIIQVSLDEGYGLAVRAARAMGSACICSSIPSLTDSFTDLDFYVDPYSVDSMAKGMHDAYLARGRRLPRFSRTWKDFAFELKVLLSRI